MTWKRQYFGPGPVRTDSVFLNDVADQEESTRRVFENRAPGVIDGCAPGFDTPGKLTVAAGAAITAGLFYELEAQSVDVPAVGVGDAVWLYLDREGRAAFTVGAPPDGLGWPDRADEPIPVERSYCVLGRAVRGASGWEDGRDVRRFVRAEPDGDTLVVGDINDADTESHCNAADFQTIQQALDYLEACDLTVPPRRVPRRIVVTKSYTVEEQIHVRVHGVRIEARPSETAEAAQVELTWGWSVEGGIKSSLLQMPEEEAGPGALFNLHGTQGVSDVTIEGFAFIREGEQETLCAIWDPGDRFCVRRCSLTPATGVVIRWVIGSPQSKVLHGVRIEENLFGTPADDSTMPLAVGILGFSGDYLEINTGWVLQGASSGCLRDSVVSRNTATIGLAAEYFDLDNRDTYAPALDCGANLAECVGNKIEDNSISGGIISIRVGARSVVRDNQIADAGLIGVWVDPATLPPMTSGAVPIGATEISGNRVLLLDDGQDLFPWWRSAVRLETSHCAVTGNDIDLCEQVSCGVSEGYVQGLALSGGGTGEILDFSFLHVPANERAHGIVVVTEATTGAGFVLNTDSVFTYTVDGETYAYRPDRTYYLPEQLEPTLTTARTMRVFLVAYDEVANNDLGPKYYLPPTEPESTFTFNVAPSGVFPAVTIEEPGITGLFDVFRDPPDGGHLVQGNDIHHRVVHPDESAPVTGFGVLLPSAHNRVTKNRITQASCGVLALADSKVGENLIYVSWMGIIAWRGCAVVGNRVRWFRKYLPEAKGTPVPQNPLFPGNPVLCGILASKHNTIEGNTIQGLRIGFENIDPPQLRAGSLAAALAGGQPTVDAVARAAIAVEEPPTADVLAARAVGAMHETVLCVSGALKTAAAAQEPSDAANFPALGLANLPFLILNPQDGNNAKSLHARASATVEQSSLVDEVWVFLEWGGNVAAGNLIDIFSDKDWLPDSEMQFHLGIISTAGYIGPPPPDMNPDLANRGFNVISDNVIRGGMIGCMSQCADVISGCRIEETSAIGIVAVSPDQGPSAGPTIEGCCISGRGRMDYPPNQDPYRSFSAVWILETVVGSRVQDSVLEGIAPVVCAIGGSETGISDCQVKLRVEDPLFIATGIYWAGDFGSCTGCRFDCRDTREETPSVLPAIVFAVDDQQQGQLDTEGNLVTGAHMYYCATRLDTDLIGIPGQSPIWNYGNNPMPPQLESPVGGTTRWTNRINWESCWYRTTRGQQ